MTGDPFVESSPPPPVHRAGAEPVPGPGLGPWRLALRRLRRNRVALAFLALFVLLVLMALAAPLWSEHVAHRGPSEGKTTTKIVIDGEEREVVPLETNIPIGPTWRGEYFLGADTSGHDVMVRLLHGARNSLLIGFTAALTTAFLALLLGLLAGYLRGWVDAVISRALDVVWSFPVVILGVALGVALALGGIQVGPIEIAGNSKAIPIAIIGVVYVPYMARPLRGQVLALREKEFVEAARAQGAGNVRIMLSEIAPNLASTALVLVPLLVANAILLEAALTFLGAGVQPPEVSWGTLLEEGIKTALISAPHIAIAPGVMLVLTVLSLNVFGDGLREALDPRARIRIET